MAETSLHATTGAPERQRRARRARPPAGGLIALASTVVLSLFPGVAHPAADQEPPGSSVSAPASGAVLAYGPVTARGSATDNVAVAEVLIAIQDRLTRQWWRGNGTWGAYTTHQAALTAPGSSSTTWSFSWVPPTAGGEFGVLVTAVDSAGNAQEPPKAWVPFTVSARTGSDESSPVSSVSAPEAGVVLGNGPVTVAGSATDDFSVAEVLVAVQDRLTRRWWRGNGTWGAYTTHQAALTAPGSSSTTWSFSWVPPSAGGEFGVLVTAVDSAGNVQEPPKAWVPFTVSGAEPTTTTTSTTTTTTSPPAGVKAVLRGLAERHGLTDAEAEDLPAFIDVVVLNVDWADLEPAPGQFDFHAIDTAIEVAENDGHTLKLRMFAGDRSPEWAKNLGGPPVGLIEPQKGFEVTVPRFWTQAFATAYDNVMARLAGRYDDEPAVRDVVISRCTTAYAEPFIRQTVLESNRQALVDAGYTTEADRRCLREQVDTHARHWLRTRSSMAFNPTHQSVDPDGGYAHDPDYPRVIMDYMRATLGARAVLGNNSLSESRIGSTEYQTLYSDLVSRGAPLYFQTAQPKKIGDWRHVLDWAVEAGANYVELPKGHGDWNENDLEAFDRDLEQNPSP